MRFDKTEEEVQEPTSLPYAYIHQQVIRNVHHFYISQMIEDAPKYADMIFKIQTAGPDDVVYLHLNTPGGYLDSGMQIINAMKSSQAHIIAALEGEVASLGTFLFLAADEFIVHDNSYLMFHNYSGFVGGKGHEQIAALESATVWSEDFLRRSYLPFLTEEEIERVIKGEDIYMHPPEIRDRLIAMVETMKAELEAAQQAEAKPKVTKKKTTKKRAAKKKATAKKKPTV